MAYSITARLDLVGSKWTEVARWLFKALHKLSGKTAERGPVDHVARLEAMTDVQLAAIGIRRDQISQFVIQRFMDI